MNSNLFIYNTLSRTKELFEPLKPPFVGMYVCGPTVYGDQSVVNKHLPELRGNEPLGLRTSEPSLSPSAKKLFGPDQVGSIPAVTFYMEFRKEAHPDRVASARIGHGTSLEVLVAFFLGLQQGLDHAQWPLAIANLGSRLAMHDKRIPSGGRRCDDPHSLGDSHRLVPRRGVWPLELSKSCEMACFLLGFVKELSVEVPGAIEWPRHHDFLCSVSSVRSVVTIFRTLQIASSPRSSQ